MTGLASLIDAGVDPGRVQSMLFRRFDAVETVEANREGWYDLVCIQFRNDAMGTDARIRLRVRFIWSPAVGGWTYRILPGDRA